MSRNITEYFSQEHPFNLSIEMTLVHILGLLICVPSVLGGSAIILSTMFGNPQIYPHSMLILSVCTGDALLGLTQFITILVHLIFNGWETGLLSGILGCKIDAFFITQSLIISVSSLVLIAMERYLVICHAVQNHSQHVVATIFFQWVVALAISAVAVSDSDYVELSKTLISCSPNLTTRDSKMMAVKIFLILVVIASMLIISYCFFSIFDFYQKRMAKLRMAELESISPNKPTSPPGLSPSSTFKFLASKLRRMSSNERLLLFKMVTLTVTFIALLSPFTFAFIYLNFFSQDVEVDTLPLWFSFTYGYCLALNSAVNPFLLYFLDPGIKCQVDFFFGMKTRGGSIIQRSSPESPPTPRIRAVHLFSRNQKDTIIIKKQQVSFSNNNDDSR